MDGVKYDQDKPRWDLLPMDEVEDVVRILTYGSKKYEDDNWMRVRPFRRRYFAAALRHLCKWRSGEITDKESGMPHLAHATCCLIFLLWGDKHLHKGRINAK